MDGRRVRSMLRVARSMPARRSCTKAVAATNPTTTIPKARRTTRLEKPIRGEHRPGGRDGNPEGCVGESRAYAVDVLRAGLVFLAMLQTSQAPTVTMRFAALAPQ